MTKCIILLFHCYKHSSLYSQVADCGMTDTKTGNQYELSSLTLKDSNYVIMKDGSENGDKFIINVCTTLVHGEGQACPMNAAACKRLSNGR